VYAVENAKAGDLADILNELYGGGGGRNEAAGRAPVYTPFGTRQRAAAARPRRDRDNRPAGDPGQPARAQPGQVLQSFADFDEYAPLQQFDSGMGQGTGGGGGGSGAGSAAPGARRAGAARRARHRRHRRCAGGVGGGGGGGQQGATGYVLSGGAPGDIFRQEVRVVADAISNSLVILATRKDYDDIREVLRKLDVVPRQVLIEVLVAEVDLGDDRVSASSMRSRRTAEERARTHHERVDDHQRYGHDHGHDRHRHCDHDGEQRPDIEHLRPRQRLRPPHRGRRTAAAAGFFGVISDIATSRSP